jgi:rod shape-determining protein MreD
VTWMARLRLLLLIVTTVVLQVTLFPDLRMFGVAPDVGLVAAVAVAYHEGPERGAVYGFANGLAIDLFLQTPLGLSALSFALVAYATGALQSGLTRTSRWFAPALGAIGGLGGGLVFVAVGALAGQEQVLALRSVPVLLLASAYDAVLAFPVFRSARWATAPDRVVARGAA